MQLFPVFEQIDFENETFPNVLASVKIQSEQQ